MCSSWLPSMGRRKQLYLTVYVVYIPKVPKSLLFAMHFSEEHVVVVDVTENRKMEVVLKNYRAVIEKDFCFLENIKYHACMVRESGIEGI